MRAHPDRRDKLGETGDAPERGYEAWKRAKVEAALEQAKDRDATVPVEVWLQLSI